MEINQWVHFDDNFLVQMNYCGMSLQVEDAPLSHYILEHIILYLQRDLLLMNAIWIATETRVLCQRNWAFSNQYIYTSNINQILTTKLKRRHQKSNSGIRIQAQARLYCNKNLTVLWTEALWPSVLYCSYC